MGSRDNSKLPVPRPLSGHFFVSFCIYVHIIVQVNNMMIRKIQKLQLLCGLCLLLQLICYKWIIPFHLIAVFLSIIIIINQRWFKVIQLQYHLYIIGLYFYRLWIMTITSIYILQIIYVILCLYIAIMLILFAFRCIL